MNVLFILVDTLRADHLGCYGYPLPTSPAIDALADQGVVFDACYAPGIPTTPAHTTLYTGMHPLSHNIVSHGGAIDLDRRTPVLPALLQKAGYTTCAVDNLYDVKPWLSRGYEFYINPSHRHPLRLMVSCDEINARAIPWLKSHANEPFFLFVHYWEPHTPYLPAEKYRLFWDGRDPCDPAVHTLAPVKETPFWGMFGDTWFRKLGPVTDADYIVSLYDGEVRHADEGVGQLLDALDSTPAAHDTLVIIMADHGEVMVRGGIFFDHHGLYEENVRVPFVARWPARWPAGKRVLPFVQQSDLAPTILSLAGLDPVDGMDGVDITSLVDGSAVSEPHSQVVLSECTWQAKWALRTKRHKLIVSRQLDQYGNPRRELYDLAADPGEADNIVETKPDVADRMESRLETWLRDGLAKHGRTEDPLVAQGITLGKRWDEWLARARKV